MSSTTISTTLTTGVTFFNASYVLITGTGAILGGVYQIANGNSPNILNNEGLITGGTLAGVKQLGNSNVFTNAVTGTITGTSALYVYGFSTVQNAGLLAGSVAGVDAVYGTTLFNAAGGTIAGDAVGFTSRDGSGVVLTNDGLIEGAIGMSFGSAVRFEDVENAGTIASTAGATGVAIKVSNASARLQLDPGSVLIGAVRGAGAAGDVLVLASGSSVGTLSGIGTEMTGFPVISIAAGASWVLEDTAAGLAAGHETIIGLTTLDSIDITDVTATSARYVAGTLALYNGVTEVAAFGIGAADGSKAFDTFALTPDGGTGTAVTISPGTGTFAATGITLEPGGSLGTSYSLAAGAALIISGSGPAIYGKTTATVSNSGAIANYGGNAIYVAGGGTINNQGGIIASQGGKGIYIYGGGNVANQAGVITGSIYGVGFRDGAAAYLDNQNGVIKGGVTGVSLENTQNNLLNSGSISGGTYGVYEYGGANTLTNSVGGVIYGATAINETNPAGTDTLYNAGLIAGVQDGIAFNGMFSITNAATGTISGNTAIYAGQASVNDTIYNAGLIAGGHDGISLQNTFAINITNALNGTISAYRAIYDNNAADGGAIYNAGLITGTGQGGVEIFTNGTIAPFAITNTATGTISSVGYALEVLNSGSLVNAGLIVGSNGAGFGFGTGVYENSGNQSVFISNARSGTIAGAGYGLNLGIINYAVTVDNAGTIEGGLGVRLGVYNPLEQVTLDNSGTIASTLGNSGTAIAFDSGGANLQLIDDPGAVFIGTVQAAAGYSNVLELASAASTGTITGIGSQFTNFNSISIDSDATWVIAGNSAGLATGETITGFTAGDTLDVTDISAQAVSYANGTLSLYTNANVLVGTLDITDTGAMGHFALATLGTGEIVFVPEITLTQGGALGDSYSLAAGGTLAPTPANEAIYGLGAATLTNAGLIENFDGNGVNFNGIGTVINQAGTIFGTQYAVSIHDGTAAYVANQGGQIIADNDGVALSDSQNNAYNSGFIVGYFATGVSEAGSANTLTNVAGGTIDGSLGVTLQNTAAGVDRLDNAGTIESKSGSTGMAVADQGGNLTLVDEASGVFIGTVQADAGSSNVLELGAGTGSISGIGSQFINFGTISIDNGATWVISGDEAGLASGQQINGFANGDTIDVTDITADSESFGNGTLSLFNAGVLVGTLSITGGDISTESFSISTDANGGVDILRLPPAPYELTATLTNGITLTSGGAYRAPFTVTNAGTINAPGTGIYSAASAEVAVFGEVSASGTGILLADGGAVYVSGSLAGGVNAINFGTGAAALYIYSTASISGLVTADATLGNALYLFGPAGAVNFAGIGSQFTGFSTINVSDGTSWTLAGNSLGLAAGETINGFINQDTLDVTDATFTSESFANGTLSLFDNGVAVGSVVIPAANASSFDFTLASDGGTGTDIIALPRYIISSTLNAGITLAASARYNAPLTVTNTGAVLSAIRGIYSTAASYVRNEGTVSGSLFAGIELTAGGTILNIGTAAMISGGGDGVEIQNAPGAVYNAGTIAAGSNVGVYLGLGGVVENGATGSISTGATGAGVLLRAAGTSGTLINYGQISGGYNGATGYAAVTVFNQGTIQGGHDGIAFFSTYSAYVSDTGASASISGDGIGVNFLGEAGTLLNSGSITGGTYGVAGYAALSITNQGYIEGGTAGISLGVAGMISNIGAAATIIGGTGIYIDDATDGVSTIDSSGSIIGTNGVAISVASGALDLTLAPSALISGLVEATGFGNVLDLASGSATGTITGIGSSFTGFDSINIDDGANWVISGNSAGLASGQVIDGYGTLDLTDIAADSESFANGVLRLYEAGSLAAALNIYNGLALTSADFSVSADTGNGTDIVLLPKSPFIISTSLSHNVILGGSGYRLPLTITNTGAVNAFSNFSAAIYSSTAGTLTNYGTVSNYSNGFAGRYDINLNAGGAITNAAGGFIQGRLNMGGANADVLSNAGTIQGNVEQHAAGAYLSNASTGTIFGGFAVDDLSSGTVVNEGSIDQTNYGVLLGGGGEVVNQASASLYGGSFGVYLGGDGTVVNAGSIGSSSGPAVDFHGQGNNLLVVDPGAAFHGTVEANSLATSNVLALGAGGAGSITGIGTSFTGFNSLVLDAGATWSLSGLTAGFNGITISGFAATDGIDLTDLSGMTPQITTLDANNVLTADGLNITFAGAALGALFTLAPDALSGIDITSDIPCFAAGTRILAATGEVLVEDICPGDVLITVRDNGPVTQKVVWTGRRAIDLRRHPAAELVRPIHIRAGAIALGLPERDLRLSPEHAIYLGGNLFTAMSLVNGTTITQEQNTTHVTYHHIELESHDVLLAEGLPCESFLDTGNKTMFENISGITTLHPDFRPGPDAMFCAPLVRDGAALDAIRATLACRALHLPQPAQKPPHRQAVRTCA
jgi:hypothetical protein